MPKVSQPVLPESAGWPLGVSVRPLKPAKKEEPNHHHLGRSKDEVGVPVSALPKLLGSLPPAKQKGGCPKPGEPDVAAFMQMQMACGADTGYIEEQHAEEDGIRLQDVEEVAADHTATKVEKNVLDFRTGNTDFRTLGHMTVTFKPGPVGMRFHDETGMILDVVQDSQAEELGVKTGMLMCKVGGRRFSRDRFMEKVNGPDDYKVFFAFSLEKIMSLQGKKEGTRVQFRV